MYVSAAWAGPAILGGLDVMMQYRLRGAEPPLAEVLPPLTATTDVWRAALRHLMGGTLPGTEYLDVETDRPAGALAAADGIAAELSYTKVELGSLGLSPPAEVRAA